MSPEVLEKGGATTTPAIDVWAIGIMFYTMVYGELPFFSSNEKDLVKKIITDPIKFKNSQPITTMGRDMIKAML
jgi:serine/threonine protein kinase